VRRCDRSGYALLFVAGAALYAPYGPYFARSPSSSGVTSRRPRSGASAAVLMWFVRPERRPPAARSERFVRRTPETEAVATR
jgi:hypothetical protein